MCLQFSGGKNYYVSLNLFGKLTFILYITKREREKKMLLITIRAIINYKTYSSLRDTEMWKKRISGSMKQCRHPKATRSPQPTTWQVKIQGPFLHKCLHLGEGLGVRGSVAVWGQPGSRVGSVLVSCLIVNQLLNASNHNLEIVLIPAYTHIFL